MSDTRTQIELARDEADYFEKRIPPYAPQHNRYENDDGGGEVGFSWTFPQGFIEVWFRGNFMISYVYRLGADNGSGSGYVDGKFYQLDAAIRKMTMYREV